MDMTTNQKPLVSIFMMCKDSVSTIRNNIESVLHQDYPNIEFVVQDGGSTDGSLEILREYGDHIRLVSEPDSGPEEGFYRALKRCFGEFLCPTNADEELMPDAASRGVDYLLENHHISAVYGDYHSIDALGNIIASHVGPTPFCLKKYITHEIIPHFGSTFFRRSCFDDVPLHEKDWTRGGGEFLFWVKLGIRNQVAYQKGFVSKSGNGAGRLSAQPGVYEGIVRSRIRIMKELFDDPKALYPYRELQKKAYAGLHLWAALSLVVIDAFEEAKKQVENALNNQCSEEIQFSHFDTYIIPKLYLHGARRLLEGAPDDALEYLNLSRRIHVIFPNVHIVRAIALCQIEEFEEAVAAAKTNLKVEKLVPEGEGARKVLSELASCLEKTVNHFTDPLLKLYSTYLERHPDDPEVLELLHTLLETTTRYSADKKQEIKEKEIRHHEVFLEYKTVPREKSYRFLGNFLNINTRISFIGGRNNLSDYFYSQASYPPFNQAYFGWIDVLQALSDAESHFSMIELGAGFGRMLVIAGVANRSTRNLPCKFWGVEAEPTHFEMLKKHFEDNELDSDGHVLLNAAVMDFDGKTNFFVGHADEWYGQFPVQSSDAKLAVYEDAYVASVVSVGLASLLKPESYIDLIHMDIQNAELMILESATQEIDQKVRRIHISTHGTEAEEGLRSLFGGLGWRWIFDFPGQGIRETPYGKIEFNDGVQSWLNPKFM